MTTPLSAGLYVGIHARSKQAGAEIRIGLVDAIEQLVRQIEQIRDGAPFVGGTGGTRRWEGGGYIYLEAGLKTGGDEEIDINVHGGRVFVRIATEEDPAGPSRDGPRAGKTKEKKR